MKQKPEIYELVERRFFFVSIPPARNLVYCSPVRLVLFKISFVSFKIFILIQKFACTNFLFTT